MKYIKTILNRITMFDKYNGTITSDTVEANLLLDILEKLEEIRCGIIDCKPK